MKLFLKNIFIFSLIIVGLSVVCLFLPPTPRLVNSPLYAKVKKDALLSNVPGPRIIFLGGSNLPFGLNSNTIKQKLNLNPVNTGVIHTVGLKMMLQNYLEHAQENDIVILSPEYSHFFGDFMNGQESTLYYASVNNPAFPLKNLDFNQVKNVLPHIPKYIFKKLDPREYFGFTISSFFSSHSFNEFGDLQKHWKMKPKPFPSVEKMDEDFNPKVIQYIKDFQEQLLANNSKIYISPPPFNKSSARNNIEEIKLIEEKLLEANIPVLGVFNNYVFEDSLFFNSEYHLGELGTNLRTVRFIEDYKTKVNQ